jgi:hypothetical protein
MEPEKLAALEDIFRRNADDWRRTGNEAGAAIALIVAAKGDPHHWQCIKADADARHDVWNAAANWISAAADD